MKLVLVDRDGTIIKEPPDKQIDSLEKLEFVPGVISGLNLLSRAGYSLVLVSNQDGLGTDGAGVDEPGIECPRCYARRRQTDHSNRQ